MRRNHQPHSAKPPRYCNTRNNEKTRLILILDDCEPMHVFPLRILSMLNPGFDLLFRRLEWNGESLGSILAVNACIYEGGHAVAKRVVSCRECTLDDTTHASVSPPSLSAVYQQIVDRAW
jgi:hypothetical protein